MTISNYDDLLQAARSQAEPQLLLFVFTKAELPEDATQEEKENFSKGLGGTLTPVVCVDKSPDELSNFTALVEESKTPDRIGTWCLLVACRVMVVLHLTQIKRSSLCK